MNKTSKSGNLGIPTVIPEVREFSPDPTPRGEKIKKEKRKTKTLLAKSILKFIDPKKIKEKRRETTKKVTFDSDGHRQGHLNS